MVVSPLEIRRWRKRSIASGSEQRYLTPGTGLNGIRLILDGIPRSRDTSVLASSSESFIPDSITYSKVMRRRLSLRRNLRQASKRISMGYLRFSGTNSSRTSSRTACRETAKLTGQSSDSLSMAGTTPAVLSVTRRRDSPKERSSSISLMALTTAS